MSALHAALLAGAMTGFAAALPLFAPARPLWIVVSLALAMGAALLAPAGLLD